MVVCHVRRFQIFFCEVYLITARPYASSGAILGENRIQIIESLICVCLFVFAEVGRTSLQCHDERHWRNKAELKMNLETSRAPDDD